MTTTQNHHLHYDAERGLLLIDDGLLAALSWPDALRIESRADGLILTEWQLGLNTDGHVGEVLEDTEEVDKPHLKIDAATAEQLGLRPGAYTAWAETGSDSIYALPSPAEPAAPAGTVPITLHLTPSEARALEALGLDHDVRMRDILTAFAADLAAANDHGGGDEGGRSGGSDERMYADQWFQRNRGPGGWGDDDGRPTFERSFSESAGGG